MEGVGVVAGRPTLWPRALVTLAFLGLVVASAVGRSATPVVLGRYSLASFGYQMLNLAILALLVVPWRRWGPGQAGCLMAAGSTFLAAENEEFQHLPGIYALLPMLRLLAGFALVAAEFGRYRARRRPARGAGAFLGLGAVLVALSGFDLILWWLYRTSPDLDVVFEGYRDRYDLGTIAPGDLVLVGDSFVWGHGVRKDQRLGDVLQRLYRGEGRRVRVFSLGIRGAGPDRYLESLARVPEGCAAGAVILATYPNDLAPRPRPVPRTLRPIQRLTLSLGRSSLAFRAVHDLLGRIETPDVEAYHRALVEDYRRDEPTFRRRWAALVAALDRFARLAERRSASRPLLVLIPLMVDYRDYPLDSANTALRDEAVRLGFEVLDLLPEFRTAFGDGRRFRAARGDNHFDARAHRFVADLIKRRLDARAHGQP